MSNVRVGQVWQHKALGSQWRVVDSGESGSCWWILHHVADNKTKGLPEWLIYDDYVLVKGAEETK